jgi:hypothetical protein
MATKSGPQITIARKSGSAALAKRMAGLTKLAAYVGVPASNRSDRTKQLVHMSGVTTGAKKKQKLVKAAANNDINNAELLFIQENGSPKRKIPARPVLKPAIEADGNKQAITNEIKASIRSTMEGDKDGAEKNMLRAAIAGQNAARKWFTDPRNNWAPNAPSTIARKGSDRPLIDTGAMRASIVGVVREE